MGSLKEKSMSSKLDWTVQTKQILKDSRQSSATRDNCVKQSRLLRMLLAPGNKLPSRSVLLIVRLLLFLEKWRKAEHFLIQLNVPTVSLLLTLLMNCVLSKTTPILKFLQRNLLNPNLQTFRED